MPWKDLDIDIVIECTGRFTDKEASEKHLKVGTSTGTIMSLALIS